MTIQSSSPFTFSMMATANNRRTAATARKPQFQSGSNNHSKSVSTINTQQATISHELDRYLKNKSDANSRAIYTQNFNLKGFFQQLSSTYACFKWIQQKSSARQLDSQEKTKLHRAERAVPQTEFEAELTDTLASQETLIGELRQPNPNPEQLLIQIPKLGQNYVKLHTFYNAVLEQIGFESIKARINGLRQRVPSDKKQN